MTERTKRIRLITWAAQDFAYGRTHSREKLKTLTLEELETLFDKWLAKEQRKFANRLDHRL